MVPSINSRRLEWPSGLGALGVRFPSLAIRSLAFESRQPGARGSDQGARALDQVAQGPWEPPGAPPAGISTGRTGHEPSGNLGRKGVCARRTLSLDRTDLARPGKVSQTAGASEV